MREVPLTLAVMGCHLLSVSRLLCIHSCRIWAGQTVELTIPDLSTRRRMHVDPLMACMEGLSAAVAVRFLVCHDESAQLPCMQRMHIIRHSATGQALLWSYSMSMLLHVLAMAYLFSRPA